MNNKIFVAYIALLSLSAAGYAGAETEIDYGGSILVDADRFDGVYNAAADSTGNTSDDISEVRRAQLYLKYKFSEDWSSKLQLGYGEKSGKTEVKDAFIVYKGWDIADITIGQDKEPFSLDLMTSLKTARLLRETLPDRPFVLAAIWVLTWHREIRATAGALGFTMWVNTAVIQPRVAAASWR